MHITVAALCNQIIFTTCMSIIKPFPNQIFIIAIIIDRQFLCIHVIPLNRAPTVKVYGYCSQLHFRFNNNKNIYDLLILEHEIFFDIIVLSLCFPYIFLLFDCFFLYIFWIHKNKDLILKFLYFNFNTKT